MRWRAATVAVLAFTSIGLPAAHAAPPQPEAAAANRVFMVSDSVGLGAKGAMPRAFPAGWEVTVTGKPALFVENMVSQYVQYQPLSAFGDNAIVAGGYNYPYWDPGRFDRSIDLMVDTLLAKGVKRVFWVTVREVSPAFYSGWNGLSSNYKLLYSTYPQLNNQLRNATLRHPELSLIDGASMADRTGITYDAIHLNNEGAAAYSALAASTVTRAPTREPAGTITEFTVAGVAGVPADATAVSLNLTSLLPRTSGYFTAYPCGGTLPTVSNLNFRASQTVASAAIVPIGVDGKVCVFQSTDSHLLVDLNGAFGLDSGFIPLTPGRALDTRSAGITAANVVREVDLSLIPGAPDGAFTAVVNFTLLGGGASGPAWLYTCGGTQPGYPSRNIAAGKVQNVMMVVNTDANGKVCVKLSQSAHFLVDLFGAFPPESDIHPITAQRLVDTRYVGGMIGAGTVRGLQVSGVGNVPATPMPQGAVLTLTLMNSQLAGWATVYACTPTLPNTSVINVEPNHEQSNAVVMNLNPTGAVCIYSATTTHATLDVSGWAGTAFLPLTPTRLVDTRFG
ncbi:MAG: hypothetical protein Q8M22_05145 [Actinomycetota bacterium]|nr:hypothetical protein [Actinomycetota bacterium]